MLEGSPTFTLKFGHLDVWVPQILEDFIQTSGQTGHSKFWSSRIGIPKFVTPELRPQSDLHK